MTLESWKFQVLLYAISLFIWGSILEFLVQFFSILVF